MRMLTGTFIGFCGAGGTGKTTTAKLLSPQINYTFLPSVARSVFREHGHLSEDSQDSLTPAERWGLQQSIQVAFIEQQAQHFDEKIVSDRTQIDQYAYALQYCADALGPMELKWLHDLVERALQFYRHIFYFPLVDFPNTSDNMRTQRPGRRLAFDCLLHGVLNNFNVPTTTVPVMCPADRVEFIKNHVTPVRIASS